MTVALTIVIFAAYASLLVELTLLRVPSVASSLNIWQAKEAVVSGHSKRYRKLFELGVVPKFVFFVLPVLIIWMTYLFPWFVIVFGPNPFGDYLYMPEIIANLVGVALIVGGRLISFCYLVTIRRHNARDSSFLHTTGVFRWSRNPGLVGLYLFVGGMWVAMPSAAMLTGVLVYMVYMHFKVRMEEDFLLNKFHRVYSNYLLKTGRYLS